MYSLQRVVLVESQVELGILIRMNTGAIGEDLQYNRVFWLVLLIQDKMVYNIIIELIVLQQGHTARRLPESHSSEFYGTVGDLNQNENTQSDSNHKQFDFTHP